jgi:hypothetical protein
MPRTGLPLQASLLAATRKIVMEQESTAMNAQVSCFRDPHREFLFKQYMSAEDRTIIHEVLTQQQISEDETEAPVIDAWQPFMTGGLTWQQFQFVHDTVRASPHKYSPELIQVLPGIEPARSDAELVEWQLSDIRKSALAKELGTNLHDLPSMYLITLRASLVNSCTSVDVVVLFCVGGRGVVLCLAFVYLVLTMVFCFVRSAFFFLPASPI